MDLAEARVGLPLVDRTYCYLGKDTKWFESLDEWLEILILAPDG